MRTTLAAKFLRNVLGMMMMLLFLSILNVINDDVCNLEVIVSTVVDTFNDVVIEYVIVDGVDVLAMLMC